MVCNLFYLKFIAFCSIYHIPNIAIHTARGGNKHFITFRHGYSSMSPKGGGIKQKKVLLLKATLVDGYDTISIDATVIVGEHHFLDEKMDSPNQSDDCHDQWNDKDDDI